MTIEEDPSELISLVVPCYNEGEVFPDLRVALVQLAETLSGRFRLEIILVDDGSRDSTWLQIQQFCQQDPRVRGLALSRNFGHQAALTCGYDFAEGDAVVSLDADLQDPPEVVVEMVAQWKQGYDLVHAVRTRREGEGWFKTWTASAFYRLFRFLGDANIRAEAGDFRLLSRRGLHALRQMREYHRFVRGMAGWIGFRATEVCYQRKPRRAGATKYPLRKMLHLATDAIVSFSILPLRLSFAAACLLTVVIMGYLCSVTIRHLLGSTTLVPGWSSLILAVVALGAANLISIGILGEYVGRIYEQVKQRPLYLVEQTTPNARCGPPGQGAEGPNVPRKS